MLYGLWHDASNDYRNIKDNIYMRLSLPSMKCSGFMIAAAVVCTLSSAGLAAESPVPGRADLADMALQSDTILSARITKTRKVSAERAPGLATGFVRLLVQADVETLISARSGVPAEIEYLVDLPLTARGTSPKLKDERVLLFLGREYAPGEFQLSHKYGQQLWQAARETDVRRFVKERADPKLSALKPTQIVSAFHVPGSLPGESESQIFVETESGRPMSLVVLNRPGETKRYAVATGDLIDASASPPEAGSLVALMLSCELPQALPSDILDTQPRQAATALAEDYGFVRASLGACDRNF